MKKILLTALAATACACSAADSPQKEVGVQAQGLAPASIHPARVASEGVLPRAPAPQHAVHVRSTGLHPSLALEGESDAGVPPTPIFAYLSDARAGITFPAYTPDQRQLVANQAQILLRDLYVHRYEKIAYYGPSVDPVPAIEDIVEHAATMSDADLHLGIERVFSATRDLHTNYFMPAPYACYSTFLPFRLTELHADRETRLVVNRTIPYWETYDPEVATMQAGDQLVSYNGASAEDSLEALIVEGAGANYDGGRRRAMEALTYRYQLLQPIPNEDAAALVLRHPDGTTYAVNLPWITYNSCADTGSSGGGSSGGSATRAPRGDLAENVYQRKFHEHTGLTAQTAGALSLTQSAEPILWYGTLPEGGKNYGYLYLESFEPQVLDIPGTVHEMARILSGPLADTTGLVIDVRDNGGGWISLGEEMLQLFSPHHVETMGFRLKNSALNAFVLDTIAPYDPGDPFKLLIDNARATRNRYSGTAPLTDDLSANYVSQAYFSPVAVLTNSGCFSTCDMFTAGMQDNGLATIWSEDVRTGGGGANVWNYSFFSEILPSDQQGPFLALPGGQDMRVAWRDAIRAGLHQGQVLEDYGVTADRSAGLSLNDVLNNDEVQYAKITADLAQIAPSMTARVSFADGGVTPVMVKAGTPLAIAATVAGTSSVAFLFDGAPIGQQAISSQGSVTLSPPGFVAPANGAHTLEIRGEESCGRVVWRAFRVVDVVP
jgi:C-terminal processing protease CtpA/Prc